MMEAYLLMLYVTLEQELAIQELFLRRGWLYNKKDLNAKEEAYTEKNEACATATGENDLLKSDRNSTLLSPSAGGFLQSQLPPDSTLSTVNTKQVSSLAAFDEIKSYTSAEKKTTSLELNSLKNHDNPAEMHVLLEMSDTDNYNDVDNLQLASDNKLCDETLNIKSREKKLGPNCAKVKPAGRKRKSRRTSFVKRKSTKATKKADGAKAENKGKNELHDVKTVKVKVERTKDNDVLKKNSVIEEKSENIEMEVKETPLSAQKESSETTGPKRKYKKRKIQNKEDPASKLPGKGRFVCPDCGEVYKFRKRYLNHKQDGKCVYICEFGCGRKYTHRTYNRYLIHLKVHRGEKDYKCTKCDKAFLQQTKLDAHMRVHTGEKPFSCDLCSYKCHAIWLLQVHVNSIHKGKNKFYCEICGLMVKRKTSLNTHYLHKHSDERPFECNICYKRFKTRRDLESIHMLIHQDSLKIQCDDCGKCFRRSGALKAHQRRHKKDMTHFCDECNKGFYWQRELVQHKRTHTGIKAYKCEMCDYKCASLRTLKKHIGNCMKKLHVSEERPVHKIPVLNAPINYSSTPNSSVNLEFEPMKNSDNLELSAATASLLHPTAGFSFDETLNAENELINAEPIPYEMP